MATGAWPVGHLHGLPILHDREAEAATGQVDLPRHVEPIVIASTRHACLRCVDSSATAPKAHDTLVLAAGVPPQALREPMNPRQGGGFLHD